MITVTVTPRLHSGYYLNHQAQTATASGRGELLAAISYALTKAMTAMQGRERQPLEYDYVLHFEEKP